MVAEQKTDEIRGRYMHARTHGQDLPGSEWRECQILVTSERLVLEGDERHEIPLADIDRLGGRYDVNQDARAVPSYSTLHVEDDVFLVTTPDHEAFEATFFRASLAGAVLFVRHPAVEGGVVQDTGWERAKVTVTAEAIELVTEAGESATIERDDVAELETDPKTVRDDERAAIEVEHTDDDGTSLETHVAGRRHHVSVLWRVLAESAKRNRANLDLDPVERRVVMALYSGVSPFGIAEFVGVDPERVEAIYDRLLELDVIEVERERTEVALTPQGRRVASETMGEQ